ncbi:hypothetical protein GWC77_23020 [Paraburkholderia sp. NMBU_R16]|uniref:hypothetical protein n=1 Tax=Paraburkholderia sp. NMBU_R16 TaxID=2698676 RepID=UPI00156471BE|nr:hypothetical protein [Paraburkholderia sp. NMBU_R16]NRO98792.1 hypothetical protein [Paraburkholderia sp. NMBU_R16]
MRDAQSGTVRGRVRAHEEAARLGAVDAPIRNLVNAMNVRGVVQTRSSCAGHRWPLLAALQTPFVMFEADGRYARRLAAAVHRDWCAANRYLHYYWAVTAQFDDAGEFVFLLECRSRRFRRSRLERDFQTLCSWAEEIFRAGEVGQRSGFDFCASEWHDTLAAVLAASKGVRGAAP